MEIPVIWIIFAHYIGDWGLQNPWVAANKGKYWMVMVAHCMVWTACICIALQWLGIMALWKALFLLTGHIVVDEIKCRLVPGDRWWLIYPDQIWHLIQCGIVASY